MTRNQILYQEQQERARSNRANETLTSARDAETARSNLANERETNRANVARETETQRSNLAREFETNRSNLVREAETSRSNLARELETNRANVAKEGETHRSNVARERETNRSNLAGELLRSRELAESTRTHLANEGLRSAEIQEIQRANQAREEETNRHNRESESAVTREQDLAFINTQRGQDLQYKLGQETNTSRELQTTLNNASNQAIAELREQGLNDRQAKEFVSKAVSTLHDDIVGLLNNGDAVREIRRLILDWTWNQRE